MINITIFLENLGNFTFQTQESKNKVIEDSENSLSINENNKSSLTAENHDVAKANTSHTDEEVLGGSTKNGDSTPQKDESFEETSFDNCRAEETIGE